MIQNNLPDAVAPVVTSKIEQWLQQQSPDLRMGYYAVAGSHLHGTATSHSDLDIRGFHCAPPCQYERLDQPKARFQTTLEAPKSEATAADKLDVEVVSHELREYGVRLSKHHFNAIEPLYSEQIIHELPEDFRTTAQAFIEQSLPGRLPARYQGMAQSLYEDANDAYEDETQLPVKELLYSLRGILAAQYVAENETVEPNLTQLAEATANDEISQLVTALIQARTDTSTEDTKPSWQTIQSQLNRLLSKDIEPPSGDSHPGLQTALDDWMGALRRTLHE